MNSSGYIAVIEWDGKKPPMSYYHRLGYLTGSVGRHNYKNASPIARRGGENHPSVTMQEGAIYCADESMARAVALLAQRYGATSVNVARVLNMAPVEATEEDVKVLRRIEEVAGRVGRPPVRQDSRDFVVECFNEMVTFRVTDAEHKPIYCPRCGSFMVDVTMYESHPMILYYDATDAEHVIQNPVSILESWAFGRMSLKHGYTTIVPQTIVFRQGAIPSKDTLSIYVERVYRGFVAPGISKIRSDLTSGLGLLLLNILDIEGRAPVHTIFNSNMSFLDAFKDDPAMAIDILDGIFISRWKLSRERNAHDRMVFIAEALERHPEISVPNILMSDTSVDLFDAAPRVESQRLHAMFNMLLRYDRENNITRDFYKIE